jgi:hypothetical protein
MRLSEVLLAKGLVTAGEVEQAIARQQEKGGRLTDNLLALDAVSDVELDTVMDQLPMAPTTVARTGLQLEQLVTMVVKTIRGLNINTVGDLRDALKLPASVIEALLREAVGRRFLEESGAAAGDRHSESRYQLTQSGKAFADEAFDHSQYVGPAPVSLQVYKDQVRKQAIGGEHIDPSRVAKAFSDLVVPAKCLEQIGPALNSGESLLLYGPPGNGKTSFAERIGRAFEGAIFIPYCIEVGGEIIRVFDPSIHEVVAADKEDDYKIHVRPEEIDARWVVCRRPFVVTGGELTLDMLDLSFNSISRFYEMPIHLKAQGGTFVVDDFGRQLARPDEILNRWIVPLEKGVDFLKLHTGKAFDIPFDQLTIFSTNMSPNDLMDEAFLRRIPYKIEVRGPTVEEFREIFSRVCNARQIAWSDRDADLVLSTLRSIPDRPLACYQATFVIDQVIAASQYQDREPRFEPALLAAAITNLYAQATEPS